MNVVVRIFYGRPLSILCYPNDDKFIFWANWIIIGLLPMIILKTSKLFIRRPNAVMMLFLYTVLYTYVNEMEIRTKKKKSGLTHQNVYI